MRALDRLGTGLGFWESDLPPGPDAIGFDVDARSFDETLERARQTGIEVDGPKRYNAWSKGFEVLDPDGRRIEFLHNDPSVFWTNG